MNEAKQLYLEWFKSVTGFDWSFNAEDEVTLEDLYRWLDNDIQLFKKFLLIIIKHPIKFKWLIDNLKPYYLYKNRQDIRMMLGEPSKLKAAPAPPMTQEEIEWRIYYDEFRERSQKSVNMVRAKRIELEDRDWLPEGESMKVDGRPRYKRIEI